MTKIHIVDCTTVFIEGSNTGFVEGTNTVFVEGSNTGHSRDSTIVDFHGSGDVALHVARYVR